MLPKRFFVNEDVYDEFLKRYSENIAASQVGDPMDPETNIGPVSSQEAQQTLKDQIARAVEAGATAIPLGDPVPERGWFSRQS